MLISDEFLVATSGAKLRTPLFQGGKPLSSSTAIDKDKGTSYSFE